MRNAPSVNDSNGNGESGTLPPLEERIQAVPFQPVS
jgi:hypothetical protein